jgi:hypothetical protein
MVSIGTFPDETPAGSPPAAPGACGDDRRGARWFVGGVWALMVLAALAYVWKFGSNVPFYDEWNMVAVLVGDREVDLSWLWSEHNGHRILLPRLLMLGLYRLTGGDFRAGMYFNVLALAALAAALIRVAGRSRGRTRYADAFFPVLLLHWGHGENFLWSWQISLVTPAVLAGVFLVILVERGTTLSPGSAVLAGACLVMLPLCGMPGLVYVVPLAPWLAYAGIHSWRSGEPAGKRTGLALWALVSAALALVAVYLLDYPELERHPHLDVKATLETTLEFLTGGLGSQAASFWPFSGAGVFGLFFLTGGILVWSLRRARSVDRSRVVGLLCFLSAVALLALSVGLGRPGFGFTPRYSVFAAPAFCCAYFIWGICSPPAVNHLAQMSLFSLAAFMLALNFQAGRDYGRDRRDHARAFVSDLQSGEPVSKLLARHAPALCPCPFGEGVAFHDWLDYCLRALHRARIGPFRSLQETEPAFREIPVPIPSSGPDPPPDGADEELPAEPHLRLNLKTPRFVCGIRLRYSRTIFSNWDSIHREGSPLFLQVFWKKSGQRRFTEAQRFIHCWDYEPEVKTVTIWVYAELEQLRIHPANTPGVFELSEVTLLAPAAED